MKKIIAGVFVIALAFISVAAVAQDDTSNVGGKTLNDGSLDGGGGDMDGAPVTGGQSDMQRNPNNNNSAPAPYDQGQPPPAPSGNMPVDQD